MNKQQIIDRSTNIMKYLQNREDFRSGHSSVDINGKRFYFYSHPKGDLSYFTLKMMQDDSPIELKSDFELSIASGDLYEFMLSGNADFDLKPRLIINNMLSRFEKAIKNERICQPREIEFNGKKYRQVEEEENNLEQLPF